MDRTARRILIVDDEATIAAHDEPFSGPPGFSGDYGRRYREGLGAGGSPTRPRFDLAVLDGSMAGYEMEELAARMLSANPSMCVLAASGYPVDIAALAVKAPGRVVAAEAVLAGNAGQGGAEDGWRRKKSLIW